MDVICKLCGTEFNTTDRRQKYCSDVCAHRARSNSNNKRLKAMRTNGRKEWAHRQAEHLNHLTYECGVDELADYIYNNYNKRRK